MKLTFLLCLCPILLLNSKTAEVESAKILAVYVFPGKSHFMMTTTIIKELIRRGHEVTTITAFTLQSHYLGSNYTEILINPPYDIKQDTQAVFGSDSLYGLDMDFMRFVKWLQNMGVHSAEHALQQPKIQEIINSNTTEGVYDLLLVEQFYQEAFLSLAYKFNIPIVSTATRHEGHFSQIMGLIAPWSFVPHDCLPFTDRMNFFERFQNSFFSFYEDITREYRYFPQVDAMIQKYFSHLPAKLPKVSEMERNISIMLINSYAPVTSSRPIMDNMIPVGGLHIYPPTPLPTDIKKFLDDADHGVIYFCLGTNVLSKHMPATTLKIFLEVFAGLKQRVLWKFEDENIPNLPTNVMIRNWLPQSDILAHPNIKVFITHSGLLGTQEGVHNGVPMLGMPFYCDQYLNIKQVVKDGYGIKLLFDEITKDTLENSLFELLENPKYKENALRASRIFRDRPINARETAIFWIEYVLRHKGASHFRSAGSDLSWYKFYILDVIAFVFATMILVVYLLVVLVRRLLLNQQFYIKLKKQ